MLYFNFHLVQNVLKYLLRFLFFTHMLFRCVVFNLKLFWGSPDIFLLLISSLIPLSSESILCVNFILFNLLRYILRHKMWYILVIFLYDIENVYSAVVRCKLEQFSSAMFFLIFSLLDLSIEGY